MTVLINCYLLILTRIVLNSNLGYLFLTPFYIYLSEVQIRSEEMHRIAEFGVAAHFDYKMPTQSDKLSAKTLLQGSTMRALPSSTTIEQEKPPRAKKKSRIASYIEALSTSRQTIVQNHLFIFLSSSTNALDGRIVSIDPSISNVADVLRKYSGEDDIISDVAADTLVIYQNGVRTSLDAKLCNGDVLTLPSTILDKLIV